MGTNNEFSMNQLFAIKDAEERVQYLLMSHEDEESLNECITELVCDDKYWSPEAEQNNNRFAFALKVELDKYDYPAFEEIFKKFLMASILGYCIPTNQLIQSLMARDEDWIKAYKPAREGMRTKRMALKKLQIRMLLKRFHLDALKFKELINTLCQYLLAIKRHERNKNVPHPSTIIAHWECRGIYHRNPRQLVALVSPYLTAEELSVFQQKMNGVHKEAVPSPM
jgi:hypothetical protein